MKPYYQEKGITIYHGDCREILPTLEPVDLVLTDPPYGIGEARNKNKSRSCLAISKDYGFATWDDAPPSADLLNAVVTKGTRAIVWGGNYFALSPSRCWLVWDKENGKNDFADCELAWTNLSGAVRKFKWRWQGMLQEDMGRKEFRIHPTQKPLPLMRWCLGFAPNAQSVLDPFMGSGTTLVAARQLGLHAIGIELKEKYCAIAVERLRQQSFSFEAPASCGTTDKGIPSYQESLLLEV